MAAAPVTLSHGRGGPATLRDLTPLRRFPRRRPYNAAMPEMLKTVFLSVVALVGALLALALVTSAGGWLPSLVGLHPGSEAQLVWDLAFTVLGGIAGIAFATYYAPCWPRSHGFSIWTLLLLGAGYGLWMTDGDFPRWFVISLPASLPVQLLLGWWFGRRASRDTR